MGRILAVAEAVDVSESDLVARLAEARFVLLGETHDHPEHHRLQARLLEGLVRAGRRPAVVLEMVTADRQEAVDSFLATPAPTPAGFAAAVDWEHGGWPPFALYEPVVRTALAADLPIRGGDLSAEERSALAEGSAPGSAQRYGLDEPLPEAVVQRLTEDIQAAHCGYLPEAAVPAMIRVQRARDASLARALLEGAGESGSALLVAGAEHARIDRGAPLALARLAPGADVASLAFLELTPDAGEPWEALRRGYGGEIPFDYVWLTARADLRDPCERFRESLERLRESHEAPPAAHEASQ